MKFDNLADMFEAARLHIEDRAARVLPHVLSGGSHVKCSLLAWGDSSMEFGLICETCPEFQWTISAEDYRYWVSQAQPEYARFIHMITATSVSRQFLADLLCDPGPLVFGRVPRVHPQKSTRTSYERILGEDIAEVLVSPVGCDGDRQDS